MTEDVGTTPRKPLSRMQRLAMFENHKGVCCICELKIQAGERWIDEHIRPLALGGSNDPDNRAPAHEACARTKTKTDMQAITKAKRVKARHIGITRSANPLPGGKSSPWKRKVSGEWVRR